MNILSPKQREAKSLLQTIGWKWHHETVKGGTLYLKIQTEPTEIEKATKEGYSLNPGIVVAEILKDGRVKMGEIR